MAATFDTTEQRILKIIDDNRETIVEFARDIYDHAELGYKEFRTSKKFVDFMKSLQLPVQTDLAITGAKAYLKKEKAGNASLALIGTGCPEDSAACTCKSGDTGSSLLWTSRTTGRSHRSGAGTYGCRGGTEAGWTGDLLRHTGGRVR